MFRFAFYALFRSQLLAASSEQLIDLIETMSLFSSFLPPLCFVFLVVVDERSVPVLRVSTIFL